MEKSKLGDISSETCVDHNDNHIDEELCFIGYGEDESSQPKKIDILKKWKVTNEDIAEFLADDSNWTELENSTFFKEIMGKYVIESELHSEELTDKHSPLDTLRLVLHSINQNRPDLWEWLEQSTVLSPDIEAMFTNDSSSHRESNGSSSLGILSYSDMSSLSYASYDGTKNEHTGSSSTKPKADTTELVGEIEELHHQNKRLNEERGRLAKQIAQTEDANNQLVHENDELLKRVQSLQNLLDKLKETEKDHDNTQVALHRLEEINQQLQSELSKREREQKELGQQLKENNDLLYASQNDLEGARQQLSEMNETLKESELALLVLKGQYESCFNELREKTALLDEKEASVRNFAEVTESLKQQKNALELQLARAEEEIASLQHANRRESTPERESELSVSTCSHSDSSTSLEPPCQSTPLPMAKAPSLRAEMRNAITSDGDVPFCGKHIFPEALYRETSSPVLLPEKRRASCSLSPLVRKRRACLRCHFLRNSASLSEKRAKLGNNGSFTDLLDLSDFELELNGDGEALVVENTVVDVQKLVSRMKSYLFRLNADAAAVIGSYAGTGVLSEAQITLIANSVGNTDNPEDAFGEHISAELRVLKDELLKTNAILTTLSRGQQFVLSMPSFLHDPHTVTERKHYQSDLLPTSDRKRHSWMKERATSVSQKSTPLHRTQPLTRSCPNLPNQWHFATRATQTEERTSSPDGPRNRSASFVAAIRKGQVTTSDDVVEAGGRTGVDVVGDADLCPSNVVNSSDRPLAEKKHHKNSHVRIANVEPDSYNNDDDDNEEEDEGKQAARKRRRSFSSGNYALAFDQEEEEDRDAQAQIAAIHAVASAYLPKQPAAAKIAAEQSKDLKNKFLAPEMESSETESAKDSANGSMESETAELPPSTDDQQALASNFLKKAFLLKPEQLTSKEIEEKFGLLSLAFKTDKFTLGKRLELQKRQRDTAEQNIEEEIKKMKEVLVKLNQQCADAEMRELLGDFQQRIEIIHLTTTRMSSRSEVYGAVQQGTRRRASVAVFHRPLLQDKSISSPISSSLHSSALVELRPRLINPTIINVNKDETLGTISISSNPKLETGPVPKANNSEDCAAQSDRMLAGTRQPEMNVENGSSARNSASKDDDAVVMENSVREVNAKEESSPKCNKYPSIASVKTTIFEKAIKGSRQILDRMPDEFPWNCTSMFRVLRYGLGSLLLIGALVSLLSTFLPSKTSACTGQLPSHYSFQEMLESIIGPYVSFRSKHNPV